MKKALSVFLWPPEVALRSPTSGTPCRETNARRRLGANPLEEIKLPFLLSPSYAWLEEVAQRQSQVHKPVLLTGWKVPLSWAYFPTTSERRGGENTFLSFFILISSTASASFLMGLPPTLTLFTSWCEVVGKPPHKTSALGR